MPEFDFGSLKPTDIEVKDNPLATEIPTESPIERKKKSGISTENLQQELNKLKKEVKTLKQEGIQERIKLPEDVYNDLWLMCKSELSKWNNKSNSMLNTTKHIINYFHIHLNNNPFDKLKGSE